MTVSSLPYLGLFLPSALAGWALLGMTPRLQGLRPGWLLVCSCAFYAFAAGSIPLLLPLLLSAAVNFALGECIRPSGRFARVVLASGIALNLLFLGYWKYGGFTEHMTAPGGHAGSALTGYLLPGVSFFTLQQIAYLADRYRGRVSGTGWRRYLLLVAFFPKLIAGPLVHAGDFIRETAAAVRQRGIGQETLTAALVLLAFGLFKKTVVADSFAVWADAVFAAPNNAHTLDAWIGVLAYAFQLYFDFSSYSDMAIGSALLFGIRLPVNFLSPYTSASVTEFWRTWHITLGAWLREYLYIPLGGNRRGMPRTVVNLMIIMLAAGVWHGVSAGFVLWGLLHGAALACHKLWKSAGFALEALPARILTFLFVVFCWVPFRSDNVMHALMLWKNMFTLPHEAVMTLPPMSVAWCIGALCICLLLPNTMQLVRYGEDERPLRVSVSLAIAAAAALFIALLPLLLGRETPYIYDGF